MGKDDKEPTQDREHLRGKKAEITDDLEEAEARSGSVDELTPERTPGDEAVLDAPIPTTGVGAGVMPGRVRPLGEAEIGEGERVLEDESKANRTPRRPG